MADKKKEKKFITNRKSVKASLIRIENYIQNFENGDIEQLMSRYSTLEELWAKYDACQSELEEINFEVHEVDRADFEDVFHSVKGNIEKIIKQIGSNAEQKISSKCNGSDKRVKLPQLDIPKFSGNYTNWLGFRDLFTSLINDNKNLSEIEKFQYLKTSLVGEALQIISSINLSAENYIIAWNLLNERYNNEEFIVNSHLEAIFDQPQLTRESVSSLRNLITNTKQNLRSLESQGLPVKEWDIIIIFILKRKLDNGSRREWELHKKSTGSLRLPTLNDFLKFLEQRCFSLEAIHGVSYQSEQFYDKSKRQVNHVVAPSYNIICKLCKSNHNLSQCDKFLEQTVSERINTVKQLGACFNCLKTNHSANQCRSTYTCRKCKRNHHSLIHLDNRIEITSKDSSHAIQSTVEDINENSESETSCALHNTLQSKEILLATSIVKLKDVSGQWHFCRALLDSGSQVNFITESLYQRLGFKSKLRKIPINGISQIQTKINNSVELCLTSRVSTYQQKLEFLILENITSELPTRFIDFASWNVPHHIYLSDPQFNIPGPVEMLLGAEVFFEILFKDQIKLGKDMPVLQNSELGWIISGKTMAGDSVKSELCYMSTMVIDQQLRKFWELEEVQKDKFYSPSEMACESHFKSNTTRDKTGRFIVRLPFKSENINLGESYHNALKRFNQMERKFVFNNSLEKSYKEFMDEYIELGHMSEAQEDNKQEGYYLPHHAVLKETSLTTKTRIVFDASAASSNGLSLNDTLLVGATIQEDIFSILLRFRTHVIALTADVEKMYRQIKLHKDDEIYQKILWRPKPGEDIKTYFLQTVTYGTASAPFLAVRCLHYLAELETNNFPEASAILKRDFYVDDVLTGADNFNGARKLKSELMELLDRGGFKLRKWLSNNPELLTEMSNIPEDPFLHLDISQTIKTLGLQWNAKSDVILYTAKSSWENVKLTKRNLLSEIAKLFDPLGILGPVICKAKLMMQKLWQIKKMWDEQVPETIFNSWKEYTCQLQSLANLQIPRRVLIDLPINLQIHGFCDASEASYGACIYIRSTDAYNNHLVRLVCSKSRVAPLKKVTLPRLELCASLLLANLCHVTVKSLNLEINKTFLWSDSTITLFWINTPPHKLKTFVANRVAEIQDLTNPSMWHHVSSNENSADILSRGCSVDQLIDSNTWWNGPSWIIKDEIMWPMENTIISDFPEDISELKAGNKFSHVAVESYDLFLRFSSFTKLQRVTAYCLRFLLNSKSKKSKHESKLTGPLKVSELNASICILIKRAQQEDFSSDIKQLKFHNNVSSKSHLKSLNPFLDEDELLRVGGRLENLTASYDKKHQIILPSKHILTKLIIRNEHIKSLHAGTQSTLSNIRQHYWPINGRNLVKSIIHNCHTCFKFRMDQNKRNQFMGNLPKHRVNPSRPFLNCGIDYGGPILIKQGTNRKSATTKAYIALFICMATRAIHLELVSSLTTKDFLSALRRFTSRRGKCANIYSDNATNFKGAHNELDSLQNFLRIQGTRDEISTSAATDGIQWHFIPPSAPNFGGLWEAGIKSVKYHIKRVVGEAKLTFEELYTLLAQIEACVNSRPLTPILDDPTDFSPLTPAHFLIGTSIAQFPEPDVTNLPTNRLSHWQAIQQMNQHFWKRWSREYIHQLQQRNKWTKREPNLQVNDMVLMKEDNLPPLQWRIARVVEVHQGSDNVVRVASVRTSSGIIKRPISKLCLLPKEQ